jgi:cytochrome c5
VKSSIAGIRFAVLFCVLATVPAALAGSVPAKKNSEMASSVQRASDIDSMRVQGEQRFRANCGRCHATPQKFPPRVMGTVVRHMRVRATFTDEDMRLILFYMTQ